MFRESLPLAKERFGGYIEDKNNFVKLPHAKKQHEVLTQLIGKTFQAYGNVGIFDPEKLATIDFLNQPVSCGLASRHLNRCLRRVSRRATVVWCDVTLLDLL